MYDVVRKDKAGSFESASGEYVSGLVGYDAGFAVGNGGHHHSARYVGHIPGAFGVPRDTQFLLMQGEWQWLGRRRGGGSPARGGTR